MSIESSQPTSTIGNFFKALLSGLFRLSLVTIVGVCLGVSIYFGVMLFYQQLAQPTQVNTTHLEGLKTRQAINNQQIDERLKQYNNRLTALENQLTLKTEALSELQSDILTLEQTLEEQTTSLAHLDELEIALQDLDKQIAQDSVSSDVITQMLTAIDHTPKMEELRREVRLLKAMELLSRSRLYLIQNNIGLAKLDLENARQVLLVLQAEAPDFMHHTITTWIERLDLALLNLPDSPIMAADDLEIAWRMLVTGLPTPASQEDHQTGTPPIPTPTGTLPASTNSNTKISTVTPTKTSTP